MKKQIALLVTAITAIIVGAAMILSGLYIQLGWDFLTPSVKINFPKELVELTSSSNDSSNLVLTDEQKENGFTKIEKNNDGSITYTIKKSAYKTFIYDLKTEARNGIDEIMNSGNYSSIKNITYNDNFSEITIMVDKSLFENSIDSLAILSCRITSIMYQNFDIDSPKKCTITIKDFTTGEIIQTETYPE